MTINNKQNNAVAAVKVFSLVELLIYFIKVSVKNSLTSFSASADEPLLWAKV